MNIQDILTLLAQNIEVEITIKFRLAGEEGAGVPISCSKCNQWAGVYIDKKTAQRALRAHHQHCSVYAQQNGWIKDMQNGANEHD